MRRISLLIGLSSLLLFACGNEESSNLAENIGSGIEKGRETVTTEEAQGAEEVDTTEIAAELEEETWEEALEGIDYDMEKQEEILWDEINLTKNQYSQFLKDLTSDSAEDEETEIFLDAVIFDGETIEFTLVSEESDPEAAEFSNTFFIFFVDSYVRQFYLVSDYSDGETHPTIIFYDVNGEVISKSDLFLSDE